MKLAKGGEIRDTKALNLSRNIVSWLTCPATNICCGLENARRISLRSWRDFVRECFSCGSEAVNASGEAVRGLVKSRVEFPPAQISVFFLIMRSLVHANFGLAESTETSIKC